MRRTPLSAGILRQKRTQSYNRPIHISGMQSGIAYIQASKRVEMLDLEVTRTHEMHTTQSNADSNINAAASFPPVWRTLCAHHDLYFIFVN